MAERRTRKTPSFGLSMIRLLGSNMACPSYVTSSHEHCGSKHLSIKRVNRPRLMGRLDSSLSSWPHRCSLILFYRVASWQGRSLPSIHSLLYVRYEQLVRANDAGRETLLV